ncbi:MAG: response regulator [Chloroflexi bacterium]|nr:response regulator [Chloroflexota bacterium]
MPTILIVDDEKPMRQFLAAALEQDGYEVVEAVNGGHALSMIVGGSMRPDLVISDVMMPLVGGVELCRVLRANSSTADIPIVLMSAAPARASTSAGADAIIGKPFDLDALEALVRRLLSERQMGAA